MFIQSCGNQATGLEYDFAAHIEIEKFLLNQLRLSMEEELIISFGKLLHRNLLNLVLAANFIELADKNLATEISFANHHKCL